MNDNEFDQKLKSLIPLAAKVDAIATAFTAGRRSARRQTRFWRGTSAAIGLICVVILAHHSSPIRRPEEMIAQTNIKPLPPLSDGSVIMMQQAILTHGPDALPEWHSMTLAPNSL